MCFPLNSLFGVIFLFYMVFLKKEESIRTRFSYTVVLQMRQVLATAAVVVVMAGQVSPVREPVRGYAGINSPWQQAVLVEPTPVAPQPPLTAQQEHSRNAAAVSNPHPSPQDAGEDKPKAAALAQSPHLGRPTFYPRPLNGSRFLRQRLRQQMQGRRTGFWRKVAGGLNRRTHPGMARLRSRSTVAKRRRRPVGSMMSLDQWRNASGVQSDTDALQNGAVLLSSTPQPKVNAFLSEWHRSYSRSQTKAQDNTGDPGFTKDVVAMGENLSISPQTSATLPTSVHSSFGSATTTNKKSTQNLAPNLPYASPPTSLASIPSVHDMTSMHFKKTNDSSSGTIGVPNEMLKTDRKFPERMTARTATTAWFPLHDTKTTPLPTKRSVTRASPDGKEILDSIQSIFQAAKTDEQELSSMKNVNHGNTSPQPLDIFSEVSPIYGFIPSDQIQSVLGPKEEIRVSQTLVPPRLLQDSKYPTSWTFTRGPYVPDLVPQTSNAISSALKSQRSTEPNLLLQLGHSIPVQEQQTWGPEHREADAGDIILDDEASDDIIVGRPAALIQAPPGQTQGLITAAPASQMHPGVPPLFRTAEEPTAEHDLEGSSLPARQSQELGPLLDFISTKYKPSHIKSVPSSVTSLQSMINTGRIPEVFRRDQVMDYIREDRLRYRQPSVDRVGEPWKNSIERIRMHPQVNESVSGGGQFVALSSLALLVAFCGYFLFSASGTSRESRGVFPPLKAAVDEAKNGLYVLLQGLDEYEDHLSKEEEQTEDEKIELKPAEEKNTTQEDIPTILRKIWDTMVPPEVLVTSGLVRHVAGRHEAVNASSLVRSSKSREKSNSVSREPYAREIPKSEKNETNDFDLSRAKHYETHYESVIQPTLGLTSVANSFLNSLINSKAIKSIISQLKVPPPNIERQNQLIGSQEEIEESTPDHVKNNSNPKLPHEPEFKDRDSMNHSQELEEANATESNPVLESHTANVPSQQDGLTIFIGTGTRHEGVREVTEKSPSARKRVILNNRLHVRHNPETDPPRTSAFVDNVPLKPLS